MKAPFEWDSFSDQPKVIRDAAFKRSMRMSYLSDFLKMTMTSLVIFPFAIIHMTLRSKIKAADVKLSDFVGIGVNLDKGESQFDLVDELGIEHVLIRVPLWEIDKLSAYEKFALEFKRRKKSVLINILQDREHIESCETLENDMRKVFQTFNGIASEYQIGNAINRIKWGFFSIKEYLKFFGIVQKIRDTEFPSYRLIGPGVIDFEYHFTIRALFNCYPINFDNLSSLLYVDRVGAPSNRQYGFFDTDRKLRLLASIVKFSSKVKNKDIYITEVNWPLKGTSPYAPTSETECVSPRDYKRYMVEYLKIALESSVVRRVYWHQLIAPGYGLIDNRHNQLRKTEGFYALKSLLSNSG